MRQSHSREEKDGNQLSRSQAQKKLSLSDSGDEPRHSKVITSRLAWSFQASQGKLTKLPFIIAMRLKWGVTPFIFKTLNRICLQNMVETGFSTLPRQR